MEPDGPRPTVFAPEPRVNRPVARRSPDAALGRYEENACFMRMLKVAGHKDVTLYELQGYGHGMVEPAIAPMLRWMQGKGSQKGLAP